MKAFGFSQYTVSFDGGRQMGKTGPALSLMFAGVASSTMAMSLGKLSADELKSGCCETVEINYLRLNIVMEFRVTI